VIEIFVVVEYVQQVVNFRHSDFPSFKIENDNSFSSEKSPFGFTILTTVDLLVSFRASTKLGTVVTEAEPS